MTTGRNNIRKRGSTWTYYRKQAETARAEALTSMSTGRWVRPDRLTVAEFLTDEWLPTQSPSVQVRVGFLARLVPA